MLEEIWSELSRIPAAPASAGQGDPISRRTVTNMISAVAMPSPCWSSTGTAKSCENQPITRRNVE